MKYPQLVSMPSAVSDWLEEQLEARGIDALVYTRYVLSLFHTHSVDVICSEEDLHLSHLKKEVKGSGGSRKRFRRTSDWWRNADAEQLKRSAAVKCLMSASDQNCEIESLVDELCAKLKEIQNGDEVLGIPEQENQQQEPPRTEITPQDLAEKYYAAFPPLCRSSSCGNSTTTTSLSTSKTSPSKLISIIPRLLHQQQSSSTKKKSIRKSSSHCVKFEADNMKATRQSNKQQRFNYFTKNKRDFGSLRNSKIMSGTERAENKTNWELSKANSEETSKAFYAIKKPGVAKKILAHSHSPVLDNKLDRNFFGFNQDDILNERNDEINMYDDLPVDIRDLLDSPSPHDDEAENVEIMNIANIRDYGKKDFIPFGTNIISSIWSNDTNSRGIMDSALFENRFNAALDANTHDSFISCGNLNELSENALDLKFSSITINQQQYSYEDSTWPSAVIQNQNNFLYEQQQNNVSSSNAFNWTQNTCDSEEDLALLDRISRSLKKLNFNEKQSSFTAIFPTKKSALTSFHPFTGGSSTSLFSFNGNSFQIPDNRDDLLTSESTHFKPINENLNDDCKGIAGSHHRYADGTTFTISSNWEKVNYTRTASGLLYTDTDYSKKYREYLQQSTSDSNNLIFNSHPSFEFVLKFTVCQNDKACQTDDDDDDVSDHVTMGKDYNFVNYNKGGDDYGFRLLITEPATKTDYSQNVNISNKLTVDSMDDDFSKQAERSESCTMEEITWGNETNLCEKCKSNDNSATWNLDWLRNIQVDAKWDSQHLRNIWNGGEMCHTCLSLNGGRAPPSITQQHNQLREDVSQDGEQLLSDLSTTLKKSYMNDELPISEISCNINELITKDRKRRHSFITSHHHYHPHTNRHILDGEVENEENSESWSFASRLEEDCLIKLSTIPTLRSVTL